jgi:hypothetical protein
MDDPYIHLSMGRNLAYYGSWGPMAGIFNSSSSSLLYTLLIAGFYFLGFGGIPTLLVINIISSLGCLFAFEKIAREMKIDADRYFIAILAFIFCIPLYHIAYLSMEHTLHIWLMLITTLKAAKYFAEEKNNTKSIITLSLFTALTIMARYETLFLGLIVGLILLYKKQFKNAVIFGLISLLPIAIFGYISVLHGEHWLPNSVLVKSTKEGEGLMFYLRYIVRWIKRLFDYTSYGLAFAMVLTALIWKIKLKSKDTTFWYSLIAVGVLILHGSFAEFGWLGRYEGYLIALSMGGLVFIMVQVSTMKWWKYAPFAIIIVFIVIRTIPNTYGYRYAMSNIYDQQYQVAQFVKEYYNYSDIVVNDIGSISYYTHATYLDLWALASTDITNYMLKYGDPDKDLIYELAEERNSKIAICYGTNFFNIPDEWKRVASWTIANKQSAASETVYFYAINEKDTKLLDEIIAFSKTIPEDITVKYYMPMPSPFTPFIRY